MSKNMSMTFRKPFQEFDNKGWNRLWFRSIAHENSSCNDKYKSIDSSDNSSSKYAPKYPKKFTLKDLHQYSTTLKKRDI